MMRSANPQNSKKNPGSLVISLDFELYWGIRDHILLEDYQESLMGGRRLIPKLLDLFRAYGIHATWATVGFLFFETREELKKALPEHQPHYTNPNLSPYPHIESIGNNEQEDPYHFASSLIQKILTCPHQEIGTHTFSHFYCLERGQDQKAFRSDLTAAKKAAEKFKVELKSLVFPRNQFNQHYLADCQELGVKTFRGNESCWFYEANNEENQRLIKKGLRFLDSHFNISGHHCYDSQNLPREPLLNIPSSRYIRAFPKRFQFLTPLRLKRIQKSLSYAAKNNLFYHLWWHPHHFGQDIQTSLDFLEKIFNHVKELNKHYGFESLNMAEVYDRLWKE